MGLQLHGISYVPAPDPDAVRRDLRAIAEELHCDTVMLIESDPERHRAAASYALELGLDVWIRPYLEDRPHQEILAHLARTAAMAEELRERYPGRVTLLVGSEFSLSAPGMIPGPRIWLRVQVLVRWRRFFDRRITRKLGVLLKAALATARESFHGPVSYAAGYWEQVDWSGFDLVGVNLYRFGTDASAYERQLDALISESSKPVVITEFGCGSFVGADRRGPGSFLIVNWFASPPRVKEGYRRDEATQAAYLGELIDLYDGAPRARVLRLHLRDAGLPALVRPAVRPRHGRLRRREDPGPRPRAPRAEGVVRDGRSQVRRVSAAGPRGAGRELRRRTSCSSSRAR